MLLLLVIMQPERLIACSVYFWDHEKVRNKYIKAIIRQKQMQHVTSYIGGKESKRTHTHSKCTANLIIFKSQYAFHSFPLYTAFCG